MNTSISRRYMLPTLFVLCLVSLYPAIFGLVASLFDWKWGTKFEFIGLRNFIKLLSSKDFYKILYNTVRFSFVAGLLEVTLGYYLAVQIDKLHIKTNIIRGILMMPLLVAGIIVALMSKVMFDPHIGIISHLLSVVGIENYAFYGAPETAMTTIILVDVWWQTSFIFIILLAGLQGIPEEFTEAASIEGASDFKIFLDY